MGKVGINRFLLDRKEYKKMVEQIIIEGNEVSKKAQEILNKYNKDKDRLKPGLAETERDKALDDLTINFVATGFTDVSNKLLAKQNGFMEDKLARCKNNADYNSMITKMFTLSGGKCNKALLDVLTSNYDLNGLRSLQYNSDGMDLDTRNRVALAINKLETPSEPLKKSIEMVTELRSVMRYVLRSPGAEIDPKKDIEDNIVKYIQGYTQDIYNAIDEEKNGELYIDEEVLRKSEDEKRKLDFNTDVDNLNKRLEEKKEEENRQKEAERLEFNNEEQQQE